ncbi:hypothetical protein [Croceicoccus sp. BE223]|uniref:DUF4139 domain-containing protein n=1 Tax=Croceicoccus sp. BE223 TaxID=2817716 RepID=UPI0028589494|nr:hypothetical protein [Croceicoccus sp. BE223]MDR7101217.1 hypothetical protein [Croceicoccus sp. BE223]
MRPRASHLALIAAPIAALSGTAAARDVVIASAPETVSVTVYRDPTRDDRSMTLDWLNGFALVSETRTVTLPPGESTIRFDNVAESMVAVSAIVTGLPGGTIEKNRNAAILSPAALVDGTLGNRVTITRTSPATGAQVSESAIVRTRADGGLVLQTGAGYEAVRCAGLPERLSFDRVPDGLSPNPVYSVDSASDTGGTYRVTLTYLASGFDWNAHYVATFAKAGLEPKRKLALEAWLTVANANGQSFADAELLAVAGKLEVTSDYRGMAEPPRGEPLRLTCYPLGNTSMGSDPRFGAPPPPPPPPPLPQASMAMADEAIIVTGAARSAVMEKAVLASEEELGDLKLYRVPMPVDVAAKSQKQVAFLMLDDVSGSLVHIASCGPGEVSETAPARLILRTRNEEWNGLGRALPAGGVTVFEPSAYGPLLLGEDRMRDFAIGEEVEIAMADTSQVLASCKVDRAGDAPFDLYDRKPHAMRATLTNPSSHAADVELRIGTPAEWSFARTGKTALQNGYRVIRVRLPAGSTKTLRWTVAFTG